MFILNCKGRILTIPQSAPLIMGILNITPDSFYGGSRLKDIDAALMQAQKMLTDGATILDIGGQSSRPGSIKVSKEEELKRVLPVIESIKKEYPTCFISIDTFYAEVAEKSVLSGADIVNDISSGNLDQNMIQTVARLKVPYIAMHMRDTPATMQHYASYENVTLDVLDFFVKKVDECHQAGITDIIIDPGFGFAKNIKQNFQLLREMKALHVLEKPILVGLSRKSMIYKTLEITPEEALNGTSVLNTISILNGAHIFRVHDVKEAKEVILLNEKLGRS